MGECQLDDLLDILDQDDDFDEETVDNGEKEKETITTESPAPSAALNNSQDDPEKEALRRKLQEMEEQMKMIKSQLGGQAGQSEGVTSQSGVSEAGTKTMTEVDMFAGNSAADNKKLHSPVKVKHINITFYRSKISVFFPNF